MSTAKTLAVLLAFVSISVIAANGVGRPIGEKLDAIWRQPLDGEPVRKSLSLGTTVVAAVDTVASRRTKETSLMITVTNTHASQNVCVGSFPTAALTCNDTECGTAANWTGNGYAAILNCTAASASQGSLVLPASQRTFAYDGTRCVCIVASGATTAMQVERVER